MNDARRLFWLVLACAPVWAQWPAQEDDLVFLFDTGFEEVFALDAAMDEPLLNYALTASGWARIDGAGAMQLERGGFQAPNQTHLGKGLAGPDGFSVEAYWVPASDNASGVILRLGRLLTVSQHDGRLRCTAGNTKVEAPLGGSARHLVVAVAADRLTLFLDGAEAAAAPRNEPVTTDPALTLRFGADGDDGATGRLSRVGLYTHAFDAARAAAHHKGLSALLEDPPALLDITGKLIAVSKAATPKEIEPYAESLAVYEYEIQEVHAGFTWDKVVRVAHWVVLDHQALPAAQARPGAIHRLRLIPFSARGPLATVHRTETLPPDKSIKRYLADHVLTQP